MARRYSDILTTGISTESAGTVPNDTIERRNNRIHARLVDHVVDMLDIRPSEIALIQVEPSANPQRVLAWLRLNDPTLHGEAIPYLSGSHFAGRPLTARRGMNMRFCCHCAECRCFCHRRDRSPNGRDGSPGRDGNNPPQMAQQNHNDDQQQQQPQQQQQQNHQADGHNLAAEPVQQHARQPPQVLTLSAGRVLPPTREMTNLRLPDSLPNPGNLPPLLSTRSSNPKTRRAFVSTPSSPVRNHPRDASRKRRLNISTETFNDEKLPLSQEEPKTTAQKTSHESSSASYASRITHRSRSAGNSQDPRKKPL